MSPEKEYLSLEEVSDLLGVNYQLIYKLVRSGDLPAARIGRVYRILRRDLNEYIERSKTTASMAGVCSSCGKAYASRMSLRESCDVCGEPICADCWDRLGVRQCKEHRAPVVVKKTKGR